MIRITAMKNGKQIQVIEYEDTEYGRQQMAELYPDCELIESEAIVYEDPV